MITIHEAWHALTLEQHAEQPIGTVDLCDGANASGREAMQALESADAIARPEFVFW